MNPYYLAIQGTYSHVDLALFHGSCLLETIQETNASASSQLIPLICAMLENNSLELADLSFIAADHGPGAFTSLRVTLTTLNGIAFCSPVRLVGVDGLTALAHESFRAANDSSITLVVALLNAYHYDVYVGLYRVSEHGELMQEIPHGYKNIDALLEDVAQQYNNPTILFCGNGAELYRDRIIAQYPTALIAPNNTLATASAIEIGRLGLALWESGISASQLKPHYLKTQLFAIKYRTQTTSTTPSE